MLENLYKALDDYAAKFKSKYVEKLVDEKGNKFRLIDTIKAEVNVLGSNYRVILSLEDYWSWVETGRKAGKMPPEDAILSWIKHRNIKPRDGISEESLTFLIRRKVGRDGIKPRPYLQKTKDEMETDKNKIIEAFKKDIKQWSDAVVFELYSEL